MELAFSLGSTNFSLRKVKLLCAAIMHHSVEVSSFTDIQEVQFCSAEVVLHSLELCKKCPSWLPYISDMNRPHLLLDMQYFFCTEHINSLAVATCLITTVVCTVSV